MFSNEIEEKPRKNEGSIFEHCIFLRKNEGLRLKLKRNLGKMKLETLDCDTFASDLAPKAVFVIRLLTGGLRPGLRTCSRLAPCHTCGGLSFFLPIRTL